MQNPFSLPTFLSARRDIPAGTVVFLVALPLCLGISIASGAPPLAGLIAGIIGGIVVSLFSGSELSVSGPAAGLASIVASAIISIGSFEAFLVCVVLAGLIQIGLGFLRAGIIGDYVPNSVIRGMLAGIGLVIIIKQLPHLVGWDTELQTDAAVFQTLVHDSITPLMSATDFITPGAVIIGVICLILVFLWDTKMIKKQKWTLLIPGPLVSVIVGTLINEILRFFAPGLALTDGSSHMVNIPMSANVGSLLIMPDFSAITQSAIWITAFTIAVVASIESLLSVEAVDKLDAEKRISDTNKELFAQGIGNTLSGLIGGLPITSVIVRSSTNVYAGGRTRLSSMVHGLLLLTSVLAIPFLLNHIPLACLAAILISVGYKLTSLNIIRESWEHGVDQFLPFIVTIVAIVFTDLLTGIGIGMLGSAFWVVRTNIHAAVTVVHSDRSWLVRFNKDLSFIHKAELKRKLRHIPNNTMVTFDGTRAMFIDHDVYDTIGEFAQAATYRNIEVEFHNIFGKRKVT